MLKIFAQLLIALLLAGSADAAFWARLGATGAAPVGAIGTSVQSSSITVGVYMFYSIFTPTTPGTVRYAHISIVSGVNAPFCVSIQSNEDAGTVLASASGVANAGTVTVDLGTDVPVLAGTQYRIQLMRTSATSFDAGKSGTSSIYRDGASSNYTCGRSTTYVATSTSGQLTILMDNNP
jgi:hypothetical protein